MSLVDVFVRSPSLLIMLLLIGLVVLDNVNKRECEESNDSLFCVDPNSETKLSDKNRFDDIVSQIVKALGLTPKAWEIHDYLGICVTPAAIPLLLEILSMVGGGIARTCEYQQPPRLPMCSAQ